MHKMDAADDKNLSDEAEDCDKMTDIYNDAANHMIWNVRTETAMTYARSEVIELMTMMI